MGYVIPDSPTKWTWIRPGMQAACTGENDNIAWTPHLCWAVHLSNWNGCVVVDGEMYIENPDLVDRLVFPIGSPMRVKWEASQPKPPYWKQVLYEMTRRGWFWLNGIVRLEWPCRFR
jgi:hypothetical protein